MKRKAKRNKKRPTGPALRFSPTAWAKLLFLRDIGDTEVGALAVTPPDDLLLVQDVRLVDQVCSCVHVSFDDDSVADFFDEQVDQGRHPEQFARIWIHTHPGDCPRPSGTDEDTFDRVFGQATWATMFILAQEGQTYARLRFNVGPGAELQLSVDVDYTHSFDGCDFDAWEAEYLSHIKPQQSRLISPTSVERPEVLLADFESDWLEAWADYVDCIENAETEGVQVL